MNGEELEEERCVRRKANGGSKSGRYTERIEEGDSEWGRVGGESSEKEGEGRVRKR